MNNQLIKRNPWNNLQSFFESPFFGNQNFLKGFGNEFERILNGKCDFEESDSGYSIELEVPGIKKDEISINVKNDILTISWKRKKENKKGIGRTRYEINEGSFTRSFDVEGADVGKIEAELKDGLLKVNLPKTENSKPKKIEII